MKGLVISYLKFHENLKIAFKSLEKTDRNKVKYHANLLHNKNFITSRILKKHIRKRQICFAHKNGFCVAISGVKEAGVDIERLKKRDFKAIIDFCFLESEKDFLAKSRNFTLDFYKIFTTKEALVKAKNLGFYALDKVSFFDRNFIKIHLLKDEFLISVVISKRRIKL